jgi:hypothetical protein
MVKCKTDSISKKALRLLPEIFEASGYAGKYVVVNDTLMISTDMNTLQGMLNKAEEKAHGEKGHLITLKQTSYAHIWVPESEAKEPEDAINVALEAARNGFPVDKDAELTAMLPEMVYMPQKFIAH